MSKLRKSVAILLTMSTISFMLMSCAGTATEGKSADASESGTSSTSEDYSVDLETDDEISLTEVVCALGSLYYPQEWEDYMEIEITDNDEECELVFSTELDGEEYELFTVIINGSDNNDSVGTITGEDGTKRNVYLNVADLGNISGLSQDDQDRLYAMQESVNTVLNNLS